MDNICVDPRVSSSPKVSGWFRGYSIQVPQKLTKLLREDFETTFPAELSLQTAIHEVRVSYTVLPVQPMNPDSQHTEAVKTCSRAGP